MEDKKNIVTAEGTFKYFDEVPALIVEGRNFEKTFYDDEAKELFLKLIGINQLNKGFLCKRGIGMKNKIGEIKQNNFGTPMKIIAYKVWDKRLKKREVSLEVR